MSAIENTITYFFRGGWVMWPLLFCSMAVIYITIERYLFYKSMDSGKDFAVNYCNLLREDSVQDAAKLAGEKKGYVASSLLEVYGLQGNYEEFLENSFEVLSAQLRSKLDYLRVIVTLSPLLGLLGTIMGMIGAFSIFDLQEGAPMAITGGIGEALIATATGLCVAILALCSHSYFAHGIDGYQSDANRCFTAYLQSERKDAGK